MRLLPCVSLAFALTASTVHADPPKPADGGCDCSDPGHERRTAAKVVAVTGLALGLAAFVVGIQGKHEWDAAKDAAEQGDAGARDRANSAEARVRYVGTGLALGGALSLGVATYLYFSAPSAKERKTVIAPVVTREQAGMALVHTF